MKIVVIGGTGRVGSALCARLAGHEVLPASPSTGVNAVTGEGVPAALAGAEVVVDVSNAPAFDADSAIQFFTVSTRNLLDEARRAGVRHYLLVSIVGADELPDAGYLRAKVAQEQLVRESGLPYTIVRATQFAEFADTIVAAATVGDTVRVPDANLELVAADDVADLLAELSSGSARNGIVELGGPQIASFADVARAVVGTSLPVAVDPEATYFGAALRANALVSRAGARHGTTTLADVRARATTP